MNHDMVPIEFVEPTVPPHFQDREKEFQHIMSLVRGAKRCGLFGIGGSGKTMLAASIAYSVRSSSYSQVIWLEVGETTQADLVIESLARAVGHSVRTLPDPKQRTGYLRAVTANKRMLIIFDDVNNDEIMTKLLDAVGAGNAVLVTGRDQGLKSITTYSLEIILVKPLPADAAGNVLLHLTGLAESKVQNVKSWQTLAESVGNLPLALEIIAGDLRFWSDRDPLRYLKSRVETGEWLKGDETTSLYQALSRNIEDLRRLEPQYTNGFACLGVFVGSGFTFDAVKAVCNFQSQSTTERFLSLLKKRMLVHQDNNGTFTLHPVVRQFARDMLTELVSNVDSENTPTPRYITYYFQLLREFGGYEWNLSQYPKLIPSEFEIFNAINTAFKQWKHSATIKEKRFYGQTSVKMTVLVSWYLNWRGYWDLRLEFCRRVTDQLTRLKTNFAIVDQEVITGDLYIDEGWVHLSRGNLDLAQKCVDLAKPFLENHDDFILSQELHAQIALKSGYASLAHDLFVDLLTKVPQNTRPWFIFSFRLADTLHALKNYKDEVILLEELLEQIQQVALSYNEIITDVHAHIAYRLAKCKILQGDDIYSRHLLEQARRLFAESGIVNQERVRTSLTLAELLFQANDTETGKNILDEALSQAKTMGDFEAITHLEELLERFSPQLEALDDAVSEQFTSKQIVTELNLPLSDDPIQQVLDSYSLPDFKQIKLKSLRERFEALIEQYEAANQQLNSTLAATDKVTIQQQIRNLEKEIQTVEEEIDQLKISSS